MARTQVFGLMAAPKQRKWTLKDVAINNIGKGIFLSQANCVQSDIENYFKREQENPGSQRPLIAGLIGWQICSIIKEGRSLLEKGYNRDVDVLYHTYKFARIYAQQNGGKWPV